ncbi:hypothetical protein PIB30_001255 [Stylosanthes scabra]|uniref:Uncharacterized protein n=1 Tax=Stylosanthes scabra TaxID=79078 RepID=A0ABU6X0N7_9FABA|nr:hypothetical protein [Stylosanthes scabra]
MATYVQRKPNLSLEIQMFIFNFIRLAEAYVTFMKSVVSVTVKDMELHVEKALSEGYGTACRKSLKVEPKKMLTKAGYETMCMSLYLRNRMKCTVFGDLVGKVAELAEKTITQIDSQPKYSVGDELEGGARPINSIEDVLNLTDAAELWILAKIVLESHAFWNQEAKLIVGKSPNDVSDLHVRSG